MDNKFRIGLYGSYGHQIGLRQFQDDETEIVAVCGISDSFADALRSRGKDGYKIYPTLEEMLKDEEIQLISICSPDRNDQESDAVKCLRAGKHVYAEKPAAYSEEGLERILLAAKESGKEFHEMADSVFYEPYWSVRKAVREGKVGEVVQVYVQKSYPLNINVRPQNEVKDGGLIRQVGIHAIRFLEHITGLTVEKVSVCQTHLGNINSHEGLFTASSWMMELCNGGVASACINYLNPTGFGSWGNECVRIFGTDGMIEITDGGRHTHLYTQSGDEGEIDVSYSGCKDFFMQIVDHLHHGTDLPMTLEEELHPLRVVIKAFDSAEVTCAKTNSNYEFL